MGIINGTFDTDLSGWSISAMPDRYGVVWDNGTAKLWNATYCLGYVANLSQDFIIDNKILSFDWWSSYTKIYGAVGYSVSVYIEGVWTSVAGMEFGWSSTDPTSGTEYIDLSQYIGKTGRILFYLRTLGANYPCYLYMWVDNVNVFTPMCPTTLKYEGNTVTLQATPRDGIGPYTIEFRKNEITIDSPRLEGQSNPITSAQEDIQVTRVYTLDNEDIRTASTGTINFSVYITDSCPIGVKSCTNVCTISIGCVAPVCNFQVT